mgnify:CR=1 FL=1
MNRMSGTWTLPGPAFRRILDSYKSRWGNLPQSASGTRASDVGTLCTKRTSLRSRPRFYAQDRCNYNVPPANLSIEPNILKH